MARNSSWDTVRLDDLATEVTVGYVGPMTHEYCREGIPFLRSKNVKPFLIDQDDIRYIGSEFHQKIGKSRLSPGDVVIVRTGAPGITAVIPDWLEEANCSDLVIVRPGNRLNAKYFAYFMNALARHQVNAHVVGAVQQHFNVGSAKALQIPLPSVDEQQRIVAVLGALDNKIELNRQMNHTLEAMAQAIFKSWFVDFDPVTAKADGRQPYGMNTDIAALFPSHFVEAHWDRFQRGGEFLKSGRKSKFLVVAPPEQIAWSFGGTEFIAL
ncbi:MAG: restriction endonuclease subunit S [Candidatus Zixiibacteriota bacterium]